MLSLRPIRPTTGRANRRLTRGNPVRPAFHASVSMAMLLALTSPCLVGNGGPPATPSALAEVAIGPTGSPAIQITRERDRVLVSFTGLLETAGTVAGPWLEITNAASPFPVDLGSGRTFFRARAAKTESVFGSGSVIELALTGPMQIHFDFAFAGVPDGIFPPKRQKLPFDATLSLEDLTLPVTLRVRGNSSLQECPFPKLTLKVSRENREGTPFFDAREIKVGTHCAEGGRGSIGRLRDERAPFREALAYEVMEELGFAGPRVRRARIDFHDISPANEFGSTGWQLTRNAVLMDDPEVIAERLGGRILEDDELQALENAGFSEQLIADLRLLHCLFGNWDYTLSTDGRGLWNTDVVAFPDGTFLPVAGDFDLASWVTGLPGRTVPSDYHPELPDLERQARYELERVKQMVKPELFQAARARFASHRGAIDRRVQSAVIDDEGRTNILRHVAAFYDVLTSMDAPPGR